MKLLAIDKSDSHKITDKVSRFSSIDIDDATYILLPLIVYEAHRCAFVQYSIDTIPYKLRLKFNKTF